MKYVTYRTFAIMSGVALGTIGLVPFVQMTAPTQFITPRQVSAEETPPARLALATSSRDTVKKTESANGSVDPHKTLKQKVDLLEKGRAYLKERPDYTALLEKQEVVRGRLMDEQEIFLKCRHKPFSVYLEWRQGDVGREVIFVEGQNDGKMIAHDGGWKSRIPAFLLEPDCNLATSDARYPITSAGLMGLVETMLTLHKEDLAKSTVATCAHMPDGEFEGRPCHVFETTHKSPAVSPTYRKSITYIDKEWNIPCCSKHYEWPKENTEADDEMTDTATLIESYQFKDVHFDQSLTDADFESSNPEYNFH